MKLVRQMTRTARSALRNPVSKRAMYVGAAAGVAALAVVGIVLYEKKAQAAQPQPAPAPAPPVVPQPSSGGGGGYGPMPASGSPGTPGSGGGLPASNQG